MTVSEEYLQGVHDERARIARRLHAAWKQWGTDGVLELMDELESGVHSNSVDYAVTHQEPHLPKDKP